MRRNPVPAAASYRGCAGRPAQMPATGWGGALRSALVSRPTTFRVRLDESLAVGVRRPVCAALQVLQIERVVDAKPRRILGNPGAELLFGLDPPARPPNAI